MKRALILYPHQLFPVQQLPDVDTVVMVEDPLFFGLGQEQSLRLHKQKLILHRASMRRYVEEVLWPADKNVDYVSLDVFMKTGDIFDHVKKAETVYIFDPVNEELTKRLLQARREREGKIAVEFLPSPNFYLKDQEIRQYMGERHSSVFEEFYQWQRERFNVLIGEDYKPVGKQWMLNMPQQKPLKEGQALPTFGVFGSNQWVEEATEYVEKHFPENPGSADFVWPTSHHEAAVWLDNFVNSRLDGFAEYHDTLDGQAIWVHHSALAASLNIGLLAPHQVVDAALRRHADKPAPLESLELFIRSVLGWREFMRGLYVTKGPAMIDANPLKQQRRLTEAWYQGNLGLPPFDDVARKLTQHAYTYDAERLMVAANLMLLCEIHPSDMRRWFQELYIDAYDWTICANVYETNRFIESNIASGLPISASSYLMQVSHYKRGEWANIWDGLYWRFIEKHRDELKKNPKTRALVQRLDRLEDDHKRIIYYRADDFLAKHTM